jgi:hypothetical protein
MKCEGLHCPGCGDHGGGELVALVVIVAIIGAVVHAIWHTIIEAAEIVALVLVSAAGLGLAAGGIYLAVRIRARQLEARARRPVPARAQVIRLGVLPERNAIGAPAPRLTTADESTAYTRVNRPSGQPGNR